ncbi:hypothetical protein [Streptomyces sp. RP5T]|uniref:hypothetical protein n=1 Tax=Streptomyces sp. RP5T TaxID=2490848 RepID=UPI000F649CB6|nr:hypothetical protein [Streptomyces sp. RP5T]RRR75428.1 hypothetical protein EHS43_33230 [Streptomyces sp. RP5T]
MPTTPASPTLDEVRLLADTHKAIQFIAKTAPGLTPEEKEREALQRFDAEVKHASALSDNEALDELHRKLDKKFEQEYKEFPLSLRGDLHRLTLESAISSIESVKSLPASEQESAVFSKVYGHVRDWLARNELSESDAFVWAAAAGHARSGEKAPPLELATALTREEQKVLLAGLRGPLRDQANMRTSVNALDNSILNSPNVDSMEELAGLADRASDAESGREQLRMMRYEINNRGQHNRDQIFRDRLVRSRQQAQIAGVANGSVDQLAPPSQRSESGANAQTADSFGSVPGIPRRSR